MTYAATNQKQARYTLSRKGKHICPGCGKKRFVRYVDRLTSQLLPDQYGKCDRADHCGYYLNPYKDGYAAGQPKETNLTPLTKKPPVFLPRQVLDKTRSADVSRNGFWNYLQNWKPERFDGSELQSVWDMYQIGTYGTESTTFPFIDEKDNVRAIQVKRFGSDGHGGKPNLIDNLIRYWYEEIHQPMPDWLKPYNEQDLRVSCLFGAHLLQQYPNNRIGLVEAPKTAVIATMYYGPPKTDSDIIWLAAYSLEALTLDRCRALAGRTVYLYPDLSIFDLNLPAGDPDRLKYGKTFLKWRTRSRELTKDIHGVRFVMVDTLETKALESDRKAGLDLADFLEGTDWRLYRRR